MWISLPWEELGQAEARAAAGCAKRMPERLTDTLVGRGTLTAAQAEQAVGRQVVHGGALDTALLELALVDEAEILEAMGQAYGLATANASEWAGDIDDRALRVFPEQWAKKHMLAPVAFEPRANLLTVLSPAPADANTVVRLGELLEITIKPLLCPEYRVVQRLAGLYDTYTIDERFKALGEAPATISSPQVKIGKAATSLQPLPFGEAVNRLRECRQRDEIAETTLRYAVHDLAYAALFIVHTHYLEGWSSTDDASSSFRRVNLPLATDSAFKVVLDTQAHYLGPLPSDDVHTAFVAQLGRPRPRAVLIVPVRIRNRTVALLYGENGSEAIPPRLAADLMLFTTRVQAALEALLMRRKSVEIDGKRMAPPRFTSVLPSELPMTSEEESGSLEPPEIPLPGVDPAADENVFVPEEEIVKALERQVAQVPLPAETKPQFNPAPVERPSETVQQFAAQVGSALEEVEARTEELYAVPSNGVGEALPAATGSEPRMRAPSGRSDPGFHIEELPPESLSDAERALDPDETTEDLEEGWDSVDVDAPPEAATVELEAVADAPTGSNHLEEPVDRTPAPRSPSVAREQVFDAGAFERAVLAESEDGHALLDELGDLSEAVHEPGGGGWDQVEVRAWDDSDIPEAEAALPSLAALQDSLDRALAEPERRVGDVDAWIEKSHEEIRNMNASLREDETLPDLSAEAWIRASSDVVRPRPLPPEVIERASILQEEPVLLTRPIDGEDEPIQLLSDSAPVGTSAIITADPLEPVPLVHRTGSSRPRPISVVATMPSPFDAEAETPPPSRLDDDPVAQFDRELDVELNLLEDATAIGRRRARDRLRGMGPAILPKLMERFPGILDVDPFNTQNHLPSYEECGVMCSLLAALGPDSHPYVVEKLDDPEPVKRFVATYFYSAVFIPEAIPRLIQRLHDEESRICMLAARTLFSYREHQDFKLVLSHLHGRLDATSLGARRHAAYLIGLFRDVTAIPRLIDVFERREKMMFDVVEDALAEITKHRLGPNVRKWRAWWSKNRTKSRIAWLIDGLAAKDVALRLSAAEELRAVTGMNMGFDEDAPKRLRDESRNRWLRWWEENGQA